MDRRIIKTHQSIKDAFLKLRDKCTPEKMKVKDICDIANINKTTFYKYYPDSLALADEIDNKTLEDVVSSFPEVSIFFDDPKTYFERLYSSVGKKLEKLRLVFKDRTDILSEKLEARFKETYSNMAETHHEKMMMSFAVGGFVRLLKDSLFSENYDAKSLAEGTTKIIDTMLT